MSFHVPSYQRGYRWTLRQVKDLLDDILEFSRKRDAGFYCLQPLVVSGKSSDRQLPDRLREVKDLTEARRIPNGLWEVVDGQQRLTTIRLILEELGRRRFYDIEYATRRGSAKFLDEIAETDEKVEDNIDYHHFRQAIGVIHEWLEGKEAEDFLNVLLKRVKFIWYEIQEEDPKEVFTRLNIGKISLTNAELIKALLLNKSNFNGTDDNEIRLWQQEIAMEWDAMEYAFQSNEFWLFLNKSGNERPTRIDFIFDMIRDRDLLQCKNCEEQETSDDYKTFRYFYQFLSVQKQCIPMAQAARAIWEKVQEIFHTLREWFDDKELYHYIGFLVCMGESVDEIYSQWTRYTVKSAFREEYLMTEIRKRIRFKDIENTYYDKIDSTDNPKINGGNKENCRPILLLHNLQTVINQNKMLAGNKKYDDVVFYKFPFHLYKSERWDVEHIDSNTENKLNSMKSRREWLCYACFGLQDEVYQDIRKRIQDFLKRYTGKDEQSDGLDEQFEELKNEIEAINGNKRLNQEEKNKIWNFTLLDSSTNRSYGNAIFPAKRRVIIGKDQGKKFDPPTIDGEGQIVDSKPEDASSSFIPPCTKHVFLKYYNTASFDPNTWNRDDAKTYEDNIKEVLKDFLS